MITLDYNIDNYPHITISLSYDTNDYITAKELAVDDLKNIIEIHPDRTTLTTVHITKE